MPMPKPNGRTRAKDDYRKRDHAVQGFPSLPDELAILASGVPQSEAEEQRISEAIYAMLPKVRELRSERLNRQLVNGHTKDTYTKRAIKPFEPETDRDP